MTYLEELWQTLFDKEITTLEHKIMFGLSEKFDRDDPIVTLAAIIVRMQFYVLLEHKASPFRALTSLRKSMEEHRRMTALISTTYAAIQQDLSGWGSMLTETNKALFEARQLAQAKVGYDPLWGFVREKSPDPPPAINPWIIAAMLGGCAITGFLGCTIAFMIFLG